MLRSAFFVPAALVMTVSIPHRSLSEPSDPRGNSLSGWVRSRRYAHLSSRTRVQPIPGTHPARRDACPQRRYTRSVSDKEI